MNVRGTEKRTLGQDVRATTWSVEIVASDKIWRPISDEIAEILWWRPVETRPPSVIGEGNIDELPLRDSDKLLTTPSLVRLPVLLSWAWDAPVTPLAKRGHPVLPVLICRTWLIQTSISEPRNIVYTPLSFIATHFFQAISITQKPELCKEQDRAQETNVPKAAAK
jgi:hypothetical protein